MFFTVSLKHDPLIVRPLLGEVFRFPRRLSCGNSSEEARLAVDTPCFRVINAAVEDLTDSHRCVALILEVFRQADEIRMFVPEPRAVAEHSGGPRVGASEHRHTRWIAQRDLAVGLVETDAGIGESIDVRGFRERAGVAAELGPHVVGDDEQDVHLFRGGCESRAENG